MPASPIIKNVAIVGATGRMGSAFCKELVKTGRHTITALIRVGSKGSLYDGVIRREVNFESKESLVSALSGQQFLVITLPVTAPEGTHSRIVQAAAKAGVTYIMPNSFSYDIRHEDMVKEDMYSAGSVAMCKEIEATGIHYIAMACGFWYQWSLVFGENFFGIDIKSKKSGLGKARFASSERRQSMPRSVKQPAYLHCELTVSRRVMLDSVHRVLGDSDVDWKSQYEPNAERYNDALKEMQAGDQSGFFKCIYTRPFYHNGGGNYRATRGLDNDKLGLSKENLDECKTII
ncbi:NAD(P)-binding protein [Fusarium austroafricanum]|uniref:NAD(P)-binding protein n=1 Tax=Fusarium austroafricanum TaxID=2364996 RepID=A0A8H4K4K9_9HYPO|nr:NAD(P)-binding protein [Fusarium austroafricanum]